MSRLLLIIVAVLCMPVFAETVQACQCVEYGTPTCANFWRSDAVFFGRVVDIKKIRQKPDGADPYFMVHFVVQESFKGVSGLRVRIGVADSMCSPKFKQGKLYLVFASFDDEINQLSTGMCSGTTSIGDNHAVLDELRAVSQLRAAETISGSVQANGWENLRGIKIEVTGNDRTLTALTTKDGQFSFTLPGPGSYKVRVTLPYPVDLMFQPLENLTLRSSEPGPRSAFEYDVVLDKSQCSYVELKVFGSNPHATATVAGNVVTATGEAVVKGSVDLINSAEIGRDYRASIKIGSFKFEKVAPGEYYLGVNALREVPTDSDAPYERTYYPATADKGEARKIQVVEGAVIENLTLPVGPRMSERRVAGTVVWKSGRRIEYAFVEVYSGDKYVRHEPVKDGKFEFILYGDFDYTIKARDISETEGHSQRIKIAAGDSSGLKLVLQPVKE